MPKMRSKHKLVANDEIDAGDRHNVKHSIMIEDRGLAGDRYCCRVDPITVTGSRLRT